MTYTEDTLQWLTLGLPPFIMLLSGDRFRELFIPSMRFTSAPLVIASITPNTDGIAWTAIVSNADPLYLATSSLPKHLLHAVISTLS